MGKPHLSCLKISFQKIFSARVALKTLYFFLVHSYLNYGNIAWGSTIRTKLKKLASKQRQAIRVIHAAKSTREKMEKMNVLNIYKLNIDLKY